MELIIKVEKTKTMTNPWKNTMTSNTSVLWQLHPVFISIRMPLTAALKYQNPSVTTASITAIITIITLDFTSCIMGTLHHGHV